MRTSLENVRSKIEAEGYAVGGTVPNRSCDKISLRCPVGHECSVSYTHFIRGRRCARCSKSQAADHLRLSFDAVRGYFNDHGYELLEAGYAKSSSRLTCLCPSGHRTQISYNHFQQGRRCVQCADIANGRRLRLNLDDVSRRFTEAKCRLLETDYVSNKTPMRYICECGGESVIALTSFQRGSRCPQCERKKQSGANHWNYNSDREYIRVLDSLRRRSLGALRRVMARTGTRKTGPSSEFLGYTHAELLAHVTADAGWPALSRKPWDLDHVFPICAFVRNGVTDPKVINALDNLRPVSREDNQKKNGKYDPRGFEEYMAGKGIAVPGV